MIPGGINSSGPVRSGGALTRTGRYRLLRHPIHPQTQWGWCAASRSLAPHLVKLANAYSGCTTHPRMSTRPVSHRSDRMSHRFNRIEPASFLASRRGPVRLCQWEVPCEWWSRNSTPTSDVPQQHRHMPHPDCAYSRNPRSRSSRLSRVLPEFAGHEHTVGIVLVTAERTAEFESVLDVQLSRWFEEVLPSGLQADPPEFTDSGLGH